MTVAELIEALKAMPQDADVVIVNTDNYHNSYTTPDCISYDVLSPTGVKADESMAVKIYA